MVAHPGFQGATRSPINDPNSALPRLRMLCTNSKNPRYNGSRSWETPRCGRSQLRSSDQNPSRVSRSNGTRNGDLAPGQKPLALSPANLRRFRVFLGSSVGWPESNDFGQVASVPGSRQPRAQGFSEGSSDLAPLLREPHHRPALVGGDDGPAAQWRQSGAASPDRRSSCPTLPDRGVTSRLDDNTRAARGSRRSTPSSLAELVLLTQRV
jgi:hypothetical protein